MHLRDAERADPIPEGDIARELCPLASLCSFLTLFLVDSLPLASERLGEPDRLSDEPADVWLGPCFSARPDGVFVPCEEVPDGTPLTVAFFSSSFLRSSSFRRSVSESSSDEL